VQQINDSNVDLKLCHAAIVMNLMHAWMYNLLILALSFYELQILSMFSLQLVFKRCSHSRVNKAAIFVAAGNLS
jgi:hypothetical protein